MSLSVVIPYKVNYEYKELGPNYFENQILKNLTKVYLFDLDCEQLIIKSLSCIVGDYYSEQIFTFLELVYESQFSLQQNTGKMRLCRLTKEVSS